MENKRFHSFLTNLKTNPVHFFVFRSICSPKGEENKNKQKDKYNETNKQRKTVNTMCRDNQMKIQGAEGQIVPSSAFTSNHLMGTNSEVTFPVT